MKFYKIKHVPTGLFYRPSKWPIKENLNKRGKVYQEKRYANSAIRYILSCGFHTPEQIKEYGIYNPPVTYPSETEFEIIEYKVIE